MCRCVLTLYPSVRADLLALMFESHLDALETELRTAVNTAITSLVATARKRFEDVVAEVATERAKGLAEVGARRDELRREMEAMQTHQEKHEGRVELNIGGYRFQTTVQTLRRVPHTFFDAYFSGRYAQDVCKDGSIFVDRDGEYFGHVLEYMRDGVVSVAEPNARPSVSLIRSLKREFGFYCIELCPEEADPQPEMAFVLGGHTLGDDERFDGDDEERSCCLASMERYDTSTEQWSAAAAMGTARSSFGACSIARDVYVIGGFSEDYENEGRRLASVEMYSPSTDTWSAVSSMPEARTHHAVVSVGSLMYVIGGYVGEITASVLKFDSLLGTWSEVANLPVVSYAMAACAVESDIFVFGGYDTQYQAQASVFKFNTVTNIWSILAPMPQACCTHSTTLLDGLVYIVGAGDSHQEVLQFNPTSEAWTTLAPTSVRREQAMSFVLGGCLYSGGGMWGGSTVERYDVARNAWEAVANMREGRQLCGAVTIKSVLPEEQDLFDTLIAKAAGRV
jgi:hypothetical protein